jgi:hypothetical protein
MYDAIVAMGIITDDEENLGDERKWQDLTSLQHATIKMKAGTSTQHQQTHSVMNEKKT